MARVKRSLEEIESDLLNKKSALEKKLNNLQEKKIMAKKKQIGELIIKHKLDEYGLHDLDLAFAKMAKELRNQLK